MSELSLEQIRTLKIRSERTIASFDSKADNNQLHTLTIHHDKHTIKPNTFIIIMPIKKPKIAKVG